jgi:CRP/FNR family transcriptional regulator, cyclic AMP receptor protein
MNRTVEIDRVLTEIPLFSACSKQELQTVFGLTTALTIPAGKVVTSEGHFGREFVVILEGAATVSINGTEIATLGRGDFFGEIALLDGGPRTATVMAETDLVARGDLPRRVRSDARRRPGNGPQVARRCGRPPARRRSAPHPISPMVAHKPFRRCSPNGPERWRSSLVRRHSTAHLLTTTAL